MNQIQIKRGDCLELMKEIPDESIDMILCDLPYGTTACKWDEIIPFDVHASWILSDIRQRLESKGKRAPLADAMIAATAIADNLILVTRNVKDFESIREVSSLMIEDWSVE